MVTSGRGSGNDSNQEAAYAANTTTDPSLAQPPQRVSGGVSAEDAPTSPAPSAEAEAALRMCVEVGAGDNAETHAPPGMSRLLFICYHLPVVIKRIRQPKTNPVPTSSSASYHEPIPHYVPSFTTPLSSVRHTTGGYLRPAADIMTSTSLLGGAGAAATTAPPPAARTGSPSPTDPVNNHNDGSISTPATPISSPAAGGAASSDESTPPPPAKWSFSWAESLLAKSRDSVSLEVQTVWIGTVSVDDEDIDEEEDEAVQDEDDPSSRSRVKKAKKELSDEDKREITELLGRHSCIPLFLPQDIAQSCYMGYCKRIMWPVFHNVDQVDVQK